MEALAIAAVALVGLWCLVVLPAMWLSGTMSQEEERREGQRSEVGGQKAEGRGRKAEEDHEEVMDGR